MDIRFVKVIKFICIAVAVLLLGALIVYACVDWVADKKRAERLDELYNQVLPYNLQKWGLQGQLAAYRSESVYSDSNCRLIIGFKLSSPDDIAYIKQLSKEYCFIPTIILDCTMENADMEKCIATAPTDWEIMLHSEEFKIEETELIKAKRAFLKKSGRSVSDIYFLRYGYNTAENVEAVYGMDFRGVTAYHHSPSSERSSDGNIRIDYSFISSNDVKVDARLGYCYSAKGDMIFAFDMVSYHSEELLEATIKGILDKIKIYTERDDCEFSTVSGAVEELDEIGRINEEKRQYFLIKSDEINAEIAELDAVIQDIYESFGDFE